MRVRRLAKHNFINSQTRQLSALNLCTYIQDPDIHGHCNLAESISLVNVINVTLYVLFRFLFSYLFRNMSSTFPNAVGLLASSFVIFGVNLLNLATILWVPLLSAR